MAERYARGPVGLPSPQQIRPQSETLTVAELILGSYKRCQRYDVKNGKVTKQVNVIKQALKFLRNLHGTPLVKDFSPLCL